MSDLVPSFERIFGNTGFSRNPGVLHHNSFFFPIFPQFWFFLTPDLGFLEFFTFSAPRCRHNSTICESTYIVF